MKRDEIKLSFIETDNESISETCRCEFCDRPIRFYRYKGWLFNNYVVQNTDGSVHRRCDRPVAWSPSRRDIPDGWEYWRPDSDDDRACYIIKKYTRFEK
jgi:hypothetical protein